jgi:hypothetical protein
MDQNGSPGGFSQFTAGTGIALILENAIGERRQFAAWVWCGIGAIEDWNWIWISCWVTS